MIMAIDQRIDCDTFMVDDQHRLLMVDDEIDQNVADGWSKT